MGIADLKARSRSDGSAKQVHPTTMMITKYLADQPYWRKNDPTYESDNQPTSPPGYLPAPPLSLLEIVLFSRVTA